MKWDLTYLFPTEELFLAAANESEQMVSQLASFKGKLGNEESFKAYFLLQKKVYETVLRAYQYAALKSDLNKKDNKSSADLQKMQIIFYQLREAVSFEEPEVIKVGKEKVFSFLDNNPELEEHRFAFTKLFLRQKHILDQKSEKLLANFGQVVEAGRELYGSLSVADIENQDVMLDNGEIVTITNSNYRAFIQKSNSENERKDIFESVFSYYDVHKNTYASIYKQVLDLDVALMKSRKYKSSLESYLFNDQIPTKVYLSLTKVARQNTKPIKKYIKLFKKALKLKKYHTYDRFLEIAKSDQEYEYEDGKELFFNSIKHFPQDFQDKAREVLKDGFVDVFEQPGKRTGAYSSSMPDLHPYILLNYSKRIDDVFTLAHEAGHSIHSMYAMEAQPSALQNYTIFVAEVASTFNEHNLLDYLIKQGNTSREEKISLLQKAIDDILGTFYRQTLFAIYELEAHKLVENNQPVTADTLSNIMIDLYKEFYGLDITEEGVKQFVWAYIPHFFYTPFYVYQYATCFAASLKIYEDVRNNVPGSFDNYINLLKSGGSDFPVEQLKKAGVDLTKPDAFKAVANRLQELVDELEVVLKSE